MKRRELMYAPLLGLAPIAQGKGPEIYTRVGAKPFINLTATFTVNGGALTRPEVKRAMEEASHYPMNLDELMDAVGRRLAELLGSEAAIVTSGASAALTHATAGCITGGDPEKIQQLPDLAGLRSEVIVAKASRNTYDQAVRAAGVRMINVDSAAEAEKALGPRTAMLFLLGTAEARGGVRLEEFAALGRKAGVPVLVDAAAELPWNPNPYLKRGADLVAYSGGKFLRGPSCAGLLLGRKDLVRAAWLNSSPHHAMGRAMKVGKEEVMGMLAAIEVWRANYDLEGEYRRWEGWLKEIGEMAAKVEGVKYELRPPAGASPFPVMNLSWDKTRHGITAGEVGRKLLEGTPRIMSHAEGAGYSFLVRPGAMKPGEAKLAGKRIAEILDGAPPAGAQPERKPAAAKLDGDWRLELEFVASKARHQMTLAERGGELSGEYRARITKGRISGHADGEAVRFRASLPYEGTTLAYEFAGRIAGGAMSGTVSLGEYGEAAWKAERIS
jgi:L-seryl-tRNA(Ser) seleniumtransferase